MEGSRAGICPWNVELHLHTVGSPCAELEMLPPFIVRRAQELGIQLLAVTDHNSAENVGAVMAAAVETGICVLPGMEVQTREEAHVLALFDTLEQVLDWQAHIYAHLPPLKNRDDVFGSQLVVDAMGDLMRLNERLLLTSTDLSVEEVVEGIHLRGGLAIAAHVDRPSYSLVTNLGFIPRGLALDAIELSRHACLDTWLSDHADLAGGPFVRSSDAHRLSEMGVAMRLWLAEPTIAGIRDALCGRQGGVELF